MIKRIAIGVALVIGFFILMTIRQNIKDETPTLSSAIYKNDIDAIKTLLATGANLAAVDEHGQQAIHVAAGANKPEALKLLIAAGAKVDAPDSGGTKPIVYAVQVGGIESVKVLVAAGARLDALDKEGRQPIHVAAYSRFDNVNLVNTLLAVGAKVDAPDSNAAQPLHWAARRGNVGIAKVLLAAGARVDAVDNNGDQPLHWAARYGNYGKTEIYDVLLAAGAKTNALNKQGESPSVIAKHIGPREGDKGNMKGGLDGATLGYLNNNLFRIFVREKMCTSSNNCGGKNIIFCSQSDSLSCELYGIGDENLAQEIIQSMRDSGLRIKKVTLWRSAYHKGSINEKPIAEYHGNV
jgi:ankyrin repeat protein